MTAPTQAFPPWLSPAPVTVTQDGTAVVQTTVVQFPQTYYGPSIPLGPGWVFGGSTFPASIATSFAAPTPSTSATPSSSPSQATFTSSSSSTSSASSASTSSTSFPPPSGSPSTSSASVGHGLSSSTRLAIILSVILGTLLLAALLVVLCHIRRRQRRRRVLTPGGNFSGWQLVNPSNTHQPLEGVREEGEAAAFLTAEQGMREHQAGPTLSHPWPKPPPPPQQPQAGEPTALAAGQTTSQDSGTGSAATKNDSSTLDSAAQRDDRARFNASGSTVAASSLFFNPARGNGEGNGQRRSGDELVEDIALPAGVSAVLASSHTDYAARPPGAGPPRVLTRSPVGRIAPSDPSYTPASPSSPGDDDPEEQFLPPRRLNPDRLFIPQNSQASSGSRGSWVYPDSPPSETDERATLLTARRVNIGPVSHPVLASPPSEKGKDLEGWVTQPGEDEDDPASRYALNRGSWAPPVGMGGLTAFARGLSRLSWFKRMDNEAGPSGTRHSSPSRSRRGPGSRPQSDVSITRPGSRARPHSGLLHPSYASRPQSGVSFRGVEAELGVRPAGVRISSAGSGSGGSGSGKSGGTVYHSASSRPRTPLYMSENAHHERQLVDTQQTTVSLPPDLDLGEGGNTIRTVDLLDLPVPERALPFSAPVLPESASSRGPRPDTASSGGTRLAFPPGLVAVPQWDKGSHSSSTNREEDRDVLEDDPPQAGHDWSSLRSKESANEMNDEGNDGTRGRSRGPVTRHSTGQQAVQVIVGEPAASETASFASIMRQHPAELGLTATSASPRSPAGLGFVLTPRVSLYASSHSDLISHSGSGSHSSRPSQYASSHSHDLSQHSSNHESEDGHPPARGPTSHRASLSAMGGDAGGPPQLPPLRPLSTMHTTIERTSEDRETEEGSGTASRPGTGTSRPTMSETTHTGTFASGTTSTGAPTTVPSMTGSSGKW